MVRGTDVAKYAGRDPVRWMAISGCRARVPGIGFGTIEQIEDALLFEIQFIQDIGGVIESFSPAINKWNNTPTVVRLREVAWISGAIHAKSRENIELNALLLAQNHYKSCSVIAPSLLVSIAQTILASNRSPPPSPEEILCPTRRFWGQNRPILVKSTRFCRYFG